MRRGRPISELSLNPEEHETLQRWARRPKSAQALALRARVILACAAGKTNTQVSHELRLSKPAVGKWRSRFGLAELFFSIRRKPPSPLQFGSRPYRGRSAHRLAPRGRPQRATLEGAGDARLTNS